MGIETGKLDFARHTQPAQAVEDLDQHPAGQEAKDPEHHHGPRELAERHPVREPDWPHGR